MYPLKLESPLQSPPPTPPPLHTFATYPLHNFDTPFSQAKTQGLMKSWPKSWSIKEGNKLKDPKRPL